MNPSALRFVVGSRSGRVDRLVADATGRGRRTVQRWMAEGRVRIDGRIARPSDMPASGSEITVDEESPRDASTPAGELVVLAEERRRVVVAKPAGVHSERGISSPSIADLLERRYGDLSSVGERPAEAGLVHRLDRDTSGVLVAALDAGEYRRLRTLFGRGGVTKQYLALAAGTLDRVMEMDLPLARRGGCMAVAGPHDDALPARTRLEPLETGKGWSLVLATMSTGVMHQVRVHMAEAGHPLVGDFLYGGPSLARASRRGQMLHALRVRIAGDLDVTAAVPGDFLEACAILRRDGL